MNLVNYVLIDASAVSRAPIRWCSVSAAEQQKCNTFGAAVADDFIAFASTHTTLKCIQVYLVIKSKKKSF